MLTCSKPTTDVPRVKLSSADTAISVNVVTNDVQGSQNLFLNMNYALPV